MQNNQSASRAARRFLEDRVRTDWSWPVPPEAWSASDEEVRGVTEFRQRFYADSSPSESDDDDERGNDDHSSPYKFDSPDSIGEALERKAQRRNRKRRMALEEEMKVNEGLRIWVERRDAWTGVASAKKHGMARRAKKPTDAEQTPSETETRGEPSSSNPPTPMSVDSPASSALPLTTLPASASSETLVPVALPLLPDNPIRQSISPRAYADIFNKIVVSSRTPAVPINLADMTKALVQGWRESGEWPPKAAPLDPLAGSKNRASALASVRTTENGGEPFLAHHPHLQKGMDSVKKIFHLNNAQGREGGHGAAAAADTAAG